MNIKVDFHLSVWQRERDRERENYHVGMRSLIFLLTHRKTLMSVCSREKVKLSSTFSRTLTGKPNDNQSNRLIFANVAFLLFLNSQSNTILFALLCSRFKSVPCPFPFPFPFLSPNGQVEIHLYFSFFLKSASATFFTVLKIWLVF